MAQRTEANARLARIRTLPDRYLRELEERLSEQQREVGQRIRDARDEKGWAQKDLAHAVHVEPNTVSRWENGRTDPGLPMLEQIADALDKPLPYFVSSPRTPAASLDEQAVRQMVREEVEGALADVEALLRDLLRREADEDPPAAAGQ